MKTLGYICVVSHTYSNEVTSHFVLQAVTGLNVATDFRPWGCCINRACVGSPLCTWPYPNHCTWITAELITSWATEHLLLSIYHSINCKTIRLNGLSSSGYQSKLFIPYSVCLLVTTMNIRQKMTSIWFIIDRYIAVVSTHRPITLILLRTHNLIL